MPQCRQGPVGEVAVAEGSAASCTGGLWLLGPGPCVLLLQEALRGRDPGLIFTALLGRLGGGRYPLCYCTPPSPAALASSPQFLLPLQASGVSPSTDPSVSSCSNSANGSQPGLGDPPACQPLPPPLCARGPLTSPRSAPAGPASQLCPTCLPSSSSHPCDSRSLGPSLLPLKCSWSVVLSGAPGSS